MTRFDDAEATYATRLLMEEGPASSDFVSTRDLVRFITDPDFELTQSQSAALFRNPQVRSSYQALRRRMSSASMPIVAAASDGDVDQRSFAGVRVVMTPSVRQPEYYVRFELEPALAGAGSLYLHIMGEAGIERRLLPLADELGEISFILNPAADPRDGVFLALLRDPRSEADFIPITRPA